MVNVHDHHLPGLDAAGWEAAFAPYDRATYQAALAYLRPADVVLDIGAGDLRFARQAARRVRRVIAVEQRAELLAGQTARPANLEVICADATAWPFPTGLTVGVLLMRHCRHYALYAARLRAAGARRLITNARWGLAVEEVRLAGPRRAYASLAAQWYACDCGAVGFAPGPAARITPASLDEVSAVTDCPRCAGRSEESECA